MSSTLIVSSVSVVVFDGRFIRSLLSLSQVWEREKSTWKHQNSTQLDCVLSDVEDIKQESDKKQAKYATKKDTVE